MSAELLLASVQLEEAVHPGHIEWEHLQSSYTHKWRDKQYSAAPSHSANIGQQFHMILFSTYVD